MAKGRSLNDGRWKDVEIRVRKSKKGNILLIRDEILDVFEPLEAKKLAKEILRVIS
ncbi:MAG: hypothetical protein ACXQTS_02780 [Candidatus Methanospirareceae archaeon]